MARNKNNKWTADLDRQLLEMKAAGRSKIVIAGAFKRTVSAIEQRLYLLRRRERMSEVVDQAEADFVPKNKKHRSRYEKGALVPPVDRD